MVASQTEEVGIDLGFHGLSYVVKLKARKGKPASKTIISDASGVCNSGRLLAIMGPSGAGKTSLLDILAGRKEQSKGQLSLGPGTPATPAEIQRHAAYVQQDDAIMSTQTAREAILMAALLTLPRSMPYLEKRLRAETIIKTFHLDGCADTLVGDPIGKVKGLSGGERKRCAVAMVAICEPKILFLDEPTSGLDAFRALTLVQVLKEMASGAKSTVICTVHQPSSDLFAIFDDLMLLLAGQTVFHGPALQAVQYFGQIGYECPQYANPADYLFMHVLTTDSETRVTELHKAWSKSTEFGNMGEAVEQLFSRNDESKEAVSLARRQGTKELSSMWTQFTVLLRRGLNDVKRNKMRGRAFIAQSIVMGSILSVIWFQVGSDQNGIQDRAGVLFFITTIGMMQNVLGVLTTFSTERGAVMREQENGMYRTLPYFISRVCCDLPLKIIGPCLFGTIAYWAVGFQPDAAKFLTFLAILILLAQAGNSMGLFLACIFPDVAMALAVAPSLILPPVMFSGFVLNPNSIPIYLTWVQWISPTKYAFAALAQIEFGELSAHCTTEQLQKVVTNRNTIITVCGIPSGDIYLERLNIQEILSVRNCAIFLLLLVIVFQVLAFSCLFWISNMRGAKAKAS